MGGCFNFFSAGTDNREAAIRHFNESAEQSRYEDGHSYSGGIGMKTSIEDGPTNFPDKEAAYQWVLDNNEKWGPAHLVRVLNGEYYYGGWCSS